MDLELTYKGCNAIKTNQPTSQPTNQTKTTNQPTKPNQPTNQPWIR